MTYISPEDLKRMAGSIFHEAETTGAAVDRPFVNGWLQTKYKERRLDEIAMGALITGKTLQGFLIDTADDMRRGL